MSKKAMPESPISSNNIVFINELYQKFLQNPASVSEDWSSFFSENAEEVNSVLADYKGPSWASRASKVVGVDGFDISTFAKKEEKAAKGKKSATGKDVQLRVQNLIESYKRFAHLAANLDPIGLQKQEYVAEIDPKNHGIDDSDLSQDVDLAGVLGLNKAKVSQVIERLNFIYANKVGCEFQYIRSAEEKKWLAEKTESTLLTDISKDEKLKALREIIRTERFEQFLHKRFPGAKRFSVEGGDSAVTAMEKMIDVSAKSGVKKVIIGMAHRGRLNTLTGVMGKPYHQMIAEFQGTPGIPESATKSGDVKYHMGYSSTREIAGNKIDLSLAFNPSHLEAVNTVVTGRVRATQDLLKDASRLQAMALLVHGDAAFMGQGLVAESLVINGVEGYTTGGVMHLIINNQIGFTANPTDSRSTRYSSDMAKIINAPIFHVNGDDVEAVIKVADIAMQYRQTFKKDVVIDLVCYRRYGHNEGDEPMYTQPVMYTKIKQHPSIEKVYSQKLIGEGTVAEADYQKIAADFDAMMSEEFEKAKTYKAKEADWLKDEWKGVKDGDKSVAKTAVSKKELSKLIEKITQVPSDFSANPKILRQLEARKTAVESGENIDWGTAESLAFSSLVQEGYPVRITGQDAGRGTFSHRHSILHDGTNGKRYNIFSAVSEKAGFEVYDSVLSEYGVLGFEYGYSLANPNALSIWEAQFGDFANGAQIMFDQFIASSEVKWLRKSGLVMLLPHGFEGQGPEHSSARLERYLQACANDNLRVCNITNPANFFHVLRRQLVGKDRKPLVIMSPKSLLRHKLAVSNVKEFIDENFRPLIAEESKIAANDKVRKVVLCSGKIYYDLLEAREEKKVKDVALIRLEQLYPFPAEELAAELKKYKNAEVIWCQEEPKNMGAWKFVDDLIEEVLVDVKHKTQRAKYVGRVACASPATGYGSYHAKEQKSLIDEALK